MNTSSPTTPFRRPTYRAPSPPTWACYEQIPYSDSGSDSDSGSESDSESGSGSGDESSSDDGVYAAARALGVSDKRGDELPDMDMDAVGDSAAAPAADVASQKDVKGKQRAVEPEQKEESPRKAARAQRKHRERTYNLRPILTIHKSQGFVWNQVWFQNLSDGVGIMSDRRIYRISLCRLT